jgi:hypothetical protein
VDGPQPEAARLRYEMAGLLALDAAATYWQPRARPDR